MTREFRPAAPDDPLLSPLLERLAFLETANDGLKSRLSAGGIDAEMRNLALRGQLESARAEVARQQEALESFCREALAAAQARDLAQAAAEESLRAREAAAQENDDLRRRVETLEIELEKARRGALDADARRLIDDLERRLEVSRRAARESESALLELRRKAGAETDERLRAAAAEFSERETLLRKAVEDDRRLLEAMEQKLEAARRGEREADDALREFQKRTQSEEGRLRALAKEYADRAAPLLKSAEADRRLLNEMEVELEQARRDAQEAARALRESDQKARAAAEERLQALNEALAEREAAVRKEGTDERRRLAETTVELERARRGAQAAEAVLRESARQDLQEAQAEAERRLERLTKEFAEREARLLQAAADDRRNLDQLRLELSQARRIALEAERDSREARKPLLEVQAEAAERLRALAAEFAEREALILKTPEIDRRLIEALELELERTRRGAQETARALRESQEKSRQAVEAEADGRLRKLAEEHAEREAKLLKAAEDDRTLLEELRRELETERAAAKEAERSRVKSLLEAPPAAAEGAAAPAGFVSPALEPVLDPGWARLLRLVRPPIDAAYAHLRRLSASSMTAGQRALLRLAAASVAQASDSLSSIELALEEGPAAGAASPALPVLEASLSAWEAAFRSRGVALAREFSANLPETAHDPKELRVAIHHVLRNVLEAVPRGGHLTVRASRGPDGGLRLEFVDDGPGFPTEWLERRFEPFATPRRGRAGLGLSLVRRTLRRWGGDAQAANGPSGKGARLTLLFAPPPPPAPAPK